MTDHYMRELLRISVAQICQTIGYHVIQATPFELLQDILHKFLNEFSRDLHRQVEHYKRTEANLDDIYVTLSNLNININELLDYTNNVEPVSTTIEVPKFPAHKNSNFNFLKPGSKEVLIRPVHIYEYLPPMLPADSNSLPSHYLHSDIPLFRSGPINTTIDYATRAERANALTGANSTNRAGEPKETPDLSPEGAKVNLSSSHMFDEEGRPTREISSVVMTTGGFISPAIEGKLPDTKVPKFVEKLMGLDAPPPASPPEELSSEHFRSGQYKHHLNNTAHKREIVAPYPSHSPKTLLNAETSELAEAVSSNQPPSSCSKDDSKDAVVNQNVSAITNLISSNKFGLSPLTQPMQIPTAAAKLLNKSKKKSLPNLQSASTAKTYVSDTESSSITTGSLLVDSSERVNRKNKKMLQKLLKPEIESALSSDYCNSVLQRHKMEKYLKKQSKHEKKLLYMQKHGDVLKKKSLAIDLPSIHGDKLPIPLPSSSNNNNNKTSKDITLTDVSNEKTCISRPGLTDISSPSFSHSSITDTSLSRIDSCGAVDNIQSCPSDKKTLTGAKLSAELDRNKLNIFKKISKQKLQKSSSPNCSRLPSPQICAGNDGQFINLPCGTTITPSPSSLKPLMVGDTNLRNSDHIDKKTKVSVNCELGGAITLSSNVMKISTNELCHQFQPTQVNESTKPKKRGRKPGSKNLPKQTVVSPNGESDVTHMKKLKRLKASKYEQQYPLHLEPRNLVANKMELSNPANDFMKALVHGDDAVGSTISTNIKDNRKERKKSKSKNIPSTMSTSEHNVPNAEAAIPTKEEVNTINKKLLRMDTILQPLGGFNDTMMDSNADVAQTFSHKSLSYKSPTNRKRPSPQIPVQQQPAPNIIHGAHQSFMSKSVIGGIPDLLKLCPFPPGPGLIPPTAQNILFPRLTPTFPIPLPNMKPQHVVKPLNAESSTNGSSLEPSLLHVSGERNYCNVPPLVPESMKLTPPGVVTDIRKTERECPTTPKLHHCTTVSEKILKTPEIWNTPETISKSIPPTPGGMSLNTYELHLQNEKITRKSPKLNIDNPDYVGGMYSQHTAPNTVLAKTSAPTTIVNTDDPIELSDDSNEYSTTDLNTVPKDMHQNQLQLTSSLNFSQMEDFLPIRKDIVKNSSGDLYLSTKDKKMFQKANKLVKNTTNFFPIPTENVHQLDLFSSEKRGVGKLAGGADLIPLISTGSAYSAKTIPSTSLTATVAAPFTLSKKDIYPTNAFENSLLSTNITDNDFLSVNNELQRKRKDHKKLKKFKDDKAKKKKDKKSKCKERAEYHEKLLHKSDRIHKDVAKDSLRCDEEQQLVNKDLLRKLKKEKKRKYKQLFSEDAVHATMKLSINSPVIRGAGKPSNLFALFNASENLPSTTSLSSSSQSFVPKLTLKLGSSQSPTPVEDSAHRNYFSTSATSLNEYERKREPSPELARISPLVTRPAKQKFSIAETLTSTLSSNPPSIGNNAFDSVNESNINAISTPKNPCVNSSVPPPSPWSSGGTISASSVLLPQQLLQPLKTQEHLGLSKLDGGLLANSIMNTSRPLEPTARNSPVPLISETSRPSSYIDAEGNRVWICPACGKVDDGSPMIGCDGCDAWYHWICVGITIAPKDNIDWFCRVCITRKKGVHVTDKKRKRSKKK